MKFIIKSIIQILIIFNNLWILIFLVIILRWNKIILIRIFTLNNQNMVLWWWLLYAFGNWVLNRLHQWISIFLRSIKIIWILIFKFLRLSIIISFFLDVYLILIDCKLFFDIFTLSWRRWSDCFIKITNLRFII